MSKFSRKLHNLAWVVLPFLAGCQALPLYHLQPQEKSATVKFYGLAKPSMCKGNTHYALETRKEGDYLVASVPAGERITIRDHFFFQGFRVITNCDVGESVVPVQGGTLVVDSGLRDSRCFIEVFNEDLAKDIGVAVNYSVGRSECEGAR